ncbi:MAG: esterase [Lachnospiraceae bacterium]|nr:esterase [Lachnospiraceae bacterium]
MLMINEMRKFGAPGSGNIFVQPVDSHDMELMDSETEYVKEISGRSDFCILAVPVSDWNSDLTPWKAAPVFGKQGFGDGASQTLKTLLDNTNPESRCFICGYSLAGLFALWTAYRTDAFAGSVAVSPSVWYPDWISYAESNTVQVPAIYLSLGDREDRARNPVMASVGDAIRRQHEICISAGINTTLEWNPGNHFADSDRRLAKGISWMLRQMC